MRAPNRGYLWEHPENYVYAIVWSLLGHAAKYVFAWQWGDPMDLPIAVAVIQAQEAVDCNFLCDRDSLERNEVIGGMFEMVRHAFNNATKRHIIDILSPVIAGVREIAEFMREELPQMQCRTADFATALWYAMQCYHGEACDEEVEDWAACARLMMYSVR